MSIFCANKNTHILSKPYFIIYFIIYQNHLNLEKVNFKIKKMIRLNKN